LEGEFHEVALSELKRVFLSGWVLVPKQKAYSRWSYISIYGFCLPCTLATPTHSYLHTIHFLKLIYFPPML